MLPDIDLSSAPWIRSLGVADPQGPNDISYKPYDQHRLEQPFIEIIRDVTRERPDQVAIDDGSMRMTYAQLYAMVCRLSHEIARADLPAGAIGIMVAYDALQPVAVLGCLAAGRPSLLLSPNSPVPYNRRIIETAKLRALIVNAADAGTAGFDGLPMIAVESALKERDRDSTPAGRLEAEEPAFIVSTSGTTGVPKLVVSTQHRSHLRVWEAVEAGHFHEQDRFLTLGSTVTGATLTRNFCPLLIGGSLQIVDLAQTSLGDVLRTIREHRVTVLRTTVSIMKLLSQLPDASAELAGLRLVWITGEAFLQADFAQMREVLPSTCRLGYALSMTETLVARWHLPEKDDHDPVRVASGYLLPGVEVLVLREDGQPCAPGEVGELIVRGEAVASGEWNDGKMVAGRFANAPGDSRQRIYRTGDLVRICDDGVLVVHGRKDRMVKVRGHRIEPALIEMCIRGVAGVADAVVVTKQSVDDANIYGFAVAGRQASADLLTAIHDALKASLPSYMRPSAIRIVDSLPINAGGKVDIAGLLAMVGDESPAPEESASSQLGSSAPEASEASKRLVADAWKFTFDRTIDNPALSFDAAGGDSLKFMQLVFRLEQLGRMTLPLRTLDIAMTQADMARALDRHFAGDAEPDQTGERIFMLPGVGGDEPRLMQFRTGCFPALSIVTLEYGEWTEWTSPDASFESVLDGLARQIEKFAPSGPVSLAGYSLGGQVALALAVKLTAAGRHIDRLLILDSDTVAARLVVSNPLPRLRRRVTLRESFRRWREASLRGEGAFALAQTATRHLISPRWAPLLRFLARHRRTVLPGRLDFYLSYYLKQSLLVHLLSAWRRSLQDFPPIPIATTLILASGSDKAETRVASWRKYAPQVTVVMVGGDHYTMFDPPQLADLCARFREACGVAAVRVAS